MNFRRFTSEAYPAGTREDAWQDVLGVLGLRSARDCHAHAPHATASLRGRPETVLVARLTAGAQHLSPSSRRAGLPLLLIFDEEGAVLETGAAQRPIEVGKLVLLPVSVDWRLSFRWDVRATALMVTNAACRDRRIGPLDLGAAQILRAEGLAAVLAQTLTAVSQALDTFSDAEWTSVDQSLAELTLGLVQQQAAERSDLGGTATQAALLRRICQTIERRLGDPDLTPARAAQAEGISERYLQKLFEQTGESFSHYLRERRLQRAWAELSNPAALGRSVSEIGYDCGFGDAANFSRGFRERFGLSPRAFRQREAGRLAMAVGTHVQRGWPRKALSGARPKRPDPAREQRSDRRDDAESRAAPRHHSLPVDPAHVHWGFFSRDLTPRLEISSGDTITVETLTQHASDDPGRMIAGDPGAEAVFRWTATEKAVNRRGAGPMDASIYGRGAGEGFGVHICTGPVAVRDAEPGDVLEVRILDIVPRPSRNPAFAGRSFGSSAAAWWGYHYGELLCAPRPRETITVYEIIADAPDPHARAVYAYRWQPQTDPFGVVHPTYDYPGVPVDPDSVERRYDVLDGVRIPLRPHFGVIGVAPREADLVDSVPPSCFGGNLDNWRLGKGATVYLPVSVPGALLSIGDPHASQGDGEVAGTAIECSMTGTFSVVLHKRATLAGRPFADLTYPLIETETDWVLTGFSHPNYLAELGPHGQSEVYAKSSLDLAMKDAFRKVRRFLMEFQGLGEDEAIALISAAVDFGVTQVVDGNWGIHAIVSKRLLNVPE